MELIFRDIKIEGSLVAGKVQSDEMLADVAKHGISVRTVAVRGVKNLPHLIELAHGGKIQGKGIVIIDEEAVQNAKDNGARY